MTHTSYAPARSRGRGMAVSAVWSCFYLLPWWISSVLTAWEMHLGRARITHGNKICCIYEIGCAFVCVCYGFTYGCPSGVFSGMDIV